MTLRHQITDESQVQVPVAGTGSGDNVVADRLEIVRKRSSQGTELVASVFQTPGKAP